MTGKLGYQLTEAADQDIADILRESERLFGPRQRDVYAGLIDAAISIITAKPESLAIRKRDDIEAGIRSFHLEFAGRRRGAAAHNLYFKSGRLNDGTSGIIVLRVLHERMEPHAHLADSEG